MSIEDSNRKTFEDFILELGHIPFTVRGSIACLGEFNFEPYPNIRIFGPTYYVRVTGENANATEKQIPVNVNELVDDVVFNGEMQLPERTVQGIYKALGALELWSDLLCFAVGNPKVIVEVQKPINVVIASQYEFKDHFRQESQRLYYRYFQLIPDERRKLAAALWWYRKGSSSAYYSLFDSYAAYWNCLEILCGVGGSKSKDGENADEQIQEYLKSKKKITAGHILHCYNNFVNYSIKEQIKDALKAMITEDQAAQVIRHCFEVQPEKDRLYQIRNDINHGNIRENSPTDLKRVRYRGMLLWQVVFALINQKLGRSFSKGFNLDEAAKQIEDLQRQIKQGPPKTP